MKTENRKASSILAIIIMGTIILAGAIYKIIECIDFSIQYGWGDYWWVIASFVLMVVIFEFLFGLMAGWVLWSLKKDNEVKI